MAGKRIRAKPAPQPVHEQHGRACREHQPDAAWAAAVPHPAPVPAGRSVPVDGAVPGDQGRQSRKPALVPHGRFLRAVLRGRGRRRRSARHRAHQARQASGRRHPHVRRADPSRRRISAAADHAGLPRRRLRAARGSGRGPETRLQGGRAPRRRAPRHARHAHRGQPARRQGAQLSHRAVRTDGTKRARRCNRRDRARLARHLDRRVRGGRGAGARICRARSCACRRAR